MMTVGELKKIIESFPDDAVACVSEDGKWFSPLGGICYDSREITVELSMLKNALHLHIVEKGLSEECDCGDQGGIDGDDVGNPPAEFFRPFFDRIVEFFGVKGR